MNKYANKTYEELDVLRRENNEKLGDLYMKATGREFTPEESVEKEGYKRELDLINEAMRACNRASERSAAMAEHRAETLGSSFRELLSNARKNPSKAEREITLSGAITNSGAINLTVHDIIPTIEEGTILPKGLNIVEGVKGNEIWPVSIDDVEMEEVGEVDSLTDQTLDFAKISPTVRRIGLTVPVSNRAIDEAAFDLLAFVQAKLKKAYVRYWAKKIYSRAEWTGNAGPFSDLPASGVIVIGSSTYKNILKAVAEFSNKGLDQGSVCLTMDAVTEAELKATPKIAGAAGGFVIENGKCCGYDYTVSHYANTEFDSDQDLVTGTGRYLLIGYYDWLAAQTHDDVRLTIDATSQAVAKKNITAVTVNMAASLTDLSTHMNGSSSTQAFACYAIMNEDEYKVLASQHAVNLEAGDTKTVSAVTNLSGATISYSSANGSVATVTNAGVISAVAAGTVVITVTATDGTNTVTDTITVTVTA